MRDLGIRISYNIKRVMRENQITQNKLSELLGVTPQNTTYLFKRLEMKKGVNISTLEKIATVLNVDISIFFEK